MATNIKGITIQFKGDTSSLDKALKNVKSETKSVESQLREVDRALKFNPGNTTLLQQKFDLLKQRVQGAKNELDVLRQAQKQLDDDPSVDKTSAEYQELARKIVIAESKVKTFEANLKRFGSVGTQQVAAVGKKFQTAGNQISSAGKKITSTMSVYGAAAIYTGSKLIESANKQAEAENKLTEIYKSRMGVGKDAVKSTLELASAQQKLGVVGDEVQIAGAQQLATYASMPQTVNTLLPAMNNLLVQQKGLNGTQEDAVSLANLFGKAMMGQTGALKRAGISFTEAQEEVLKYGTEEEKAAMIAEVVTQNVGNMNAEFAKTDAGKIQQAKNTLADMGEEVGAVLLPAVADFVKYMQANLMPKLENLIEFLKQHPEIAKFALAFAAIATVLGPVLVILGSLISAIGTIITLAPTVGPAIAAIAGPVGIVIGIIAALIAVGVLLYKNWDTIKEKAAALKDFVVSVFGTMKEKVSSMFNSIKDAMVKPIETAKNIIKGIIDAIKNFFNFKVSLPKIKVPHFSISPKGWRISDLLEGVIPSLGVKWYKQGGIFNSPSVIGVGEAGPEAVLPIEKLQGMMTNMADNIVNGILMGQQLAAAGAVPGEIRIENYMYKNGPQMGEIIVKTNEKYSKILGVR